MQHTPEHLWDALYRIGSEDGTADKIEPVVVAKLIKFKIVELTAAGLPQLTPYGEKCFVVMESGDGEVPELDSYDRQESEVEQRMKAVHRARLRDILARLDQWQTEADRLVADPVCADVAARAEELRELLFDMQARVEQHLDDITP